MPFFARWPGRIAAGSHSDHISAFWDFLPTVCDFAGVNTPRGLDGISFAPTLLGKGGQQEHSFLFWAFYERGGRVALRKGDWKLVKYDVDKNPSAQWELYDLSKDVGETNNVAGYFPEVVNELSKLAENSIEPSPLETFRFNRSVN